MLLALLREIHYRFFSYFLLTLNIFLFLAPPPISNERSKCRGNKRERETKAASPTSRNRLLPAGAPAKLDGACADRALLTSLPGFFQGVGRSPDKQKKIEKNKTRGRTATGLSDIQPRAVGRGTSSRRPPIKIPGAPKVNFNPASPGLRRLRETGLSRTELE